MADQAATELCQTIIEDYHPALESLRVDVILDKKDTAAWGVTKKVSGLNAFLAGPAIFRETGEGGEDFFVVVLSQLVWGQLTDDQKNALMDHQLAWCDVEEDDAGNVKLSVNGPAFGEFPEIIDRHGVNWRPDLQAFFRRVHKSGQLSLLDLGDPKPGRAGRIGKALDDLEAAGATLEYAPCR